MLWTFLNADKPESAVGARSHPWPGGIGAALGVFVLLGATWFLAWLLLAPSRGRLQASSMPPLSTAPAVSPLIPRDVTPPADALPQADRSQPADAAAPQRPEWLSAEPVTDGSRRFVVVSSSQFATEADAVRHAETQARSILEEDLRQFMNGPVRPRFLPAVYTAACTEHAVRDRYVEVVQRDFGSFFAPMYRVWLRLELSPETREQFLLDWRDLVSQARTRFVVTTFGGMMLLPLAVVVASQSKRRLSTRAAVGVNVAVALSLLMAWGGLLWHLSRRIVL